MKIAFLSGFPLHGNDHQKLVVEATDARNKVIQIRHRFWLKACTSIILELFV